MTDENQIEDQEVELHDEVTDEVVEEAHDPKNAEAQSIASVDKAEKAGKTAPKRKGDNPKGDTKIVPGGTQFKDPATMKAESVYNNMKALTDAYASIYAEKVEEDSIEEKKE